MSDGSNQEKLDFVVLERLIKMVGTSTKELEWLIEQQSRLRVEYLTFYKKDLKEIFAGLKEILPPTSEAGVPTAIEQTMTSIIQHHRRDLERSYSVLDGRYLGIAQSELERTIKTELERTFRASLLQQITDFRETQTDSDAKKALEAFAKKVREA